MGVKTFAINSPLFETEEEIDGEVTIDYFVEE